MDTGSPIPIPATDSLTEAGLIERAKKDAGAFAALYQRHYSTVVGYLYRRTGDTHVAEDLASETFLAAMAALPRYRVTEIPLRIWLLRIATNAANKWSRQRQKLRLERAAFTPIASGPTGERQAALEEAQRALLALSAEHQAVLSLHYLESLSVDDVAAVLGCQLGTVKSRLSRARAAMKAELERRSNDHG